MIECRLGFVILNYKTAGLVLDCLQSLSTEIDLEQDHVVIVDNASGDSSPAEIAAGIAANGWDGWVTLIESETNDGFSAGNNVGIKALAADAYWLTNSDTLFRRGAIATIISAMQATPDVGIFSPRLEWPDGTPQISCFRYLSAASEMIDAARTGPVTKLLNRYDVPLPVKDVPTFPEWTSFASVVIRNQLIQSVGLMDEAFFMYYEDVDYCRLALNAGWLIKNIPDAHVVHLRGGSSSVKSDTASRRRRPRYYYASRAHYFKKHRGTLGFWWANVCWETGRAIAWVRETVGSKAPHTCEEEWRDIWIDD